jgi:hypothetical protein
LLAIDVRRLPIKAPVGFSDAVTFLLVVRKRGRDVAAFSVGEPDVVSVLRGLVVDSVPPTTI